MSKDFNAYTTQVAVSQNNKTTTALYGNLEAAEKHNFGEILSANSKIKIIINDFSKGKGSAATKVYYNLEIAEAEYIYEQVIIGKFSRFFSCKSMDAYPERDGKYMGLCQVRMIEISYIDTNDRYPWKITITNGYGKEGKISVNKKSAQMFFNDIEFVRLFRSAKRYIDAFVDAIKNDLLSNGLKQIAENTKGYVDVSLQSDKPTYPLSDDVSCAERFSNPKANQDLASKDIRIMKMQIVNDFVAIAGAYITKVLISGKEYKLYLKEVTEPLRQAYVNKTIVTARLFDWGGKLCLEGIE